MTNHGPYSPEQEQEDVSRSQLATCLHGYGWIMGSLYRDIGEDCYVRILDNGDPSGLTFMVQLKSTTDLEKHAIRGEQFSYSIKVSHLKQWEGSAIPVFFILWDVTEEEGRWVKVLDAIEELRQRRPDWRDQKSARIRVPDENGMGDEDLQRLRKLVADHSFESVRRARDLEIKGRFVFPKTPEGKQAYEGLQEHIRSGEMVEIPGKYIGELRFPQWWQRLYGKESPDIAHIKMESNPGETVVPAQITMTPEDGHSTSWGYVELKCEKAGEEVAVISNKEQEHPMMFRLRWDLSTGKMTINMEVRGPGSNIKETREVMDFISACADGGIFSCHFLKENEGFEKEVDKGTMSPPDEGLADFVDQACLIQSEMGVELALPPDWRVTEEDIEAAHEIATIIRTGRYRMEEKVTLSHEVTREGVLKTLETFEDQDTVAVRVESDSVNKQLLGKEIDLGPIILTMNGNLAQDKAELRRMAEGMADDELAEVRLVGTEALHEFPNWLPSNDH